jgi:hypothetical protein
MLLHRFFSLFLLIFFGVTATFSQINIATVRSPDKELQLTVGMTGTGTPYYMVTRHGKKIIGKSNLGLVCRGIDFSKSLKYVTQTTPYHDETWKPVWGEEDSIRDQHQGLVYELITRDGHHINLHFKLFNNGLGFRYEIPGEKDQKELVVLDEKTEFLMTGDHTTWWNPQDWDSNEHTYTQSFISQIDATQHLTDIEPFNQHIVDVTGVQTPVIMRAYDGTHIAIAEAALLDYGAMQLSLDKKAKRFTSFIIPTADSTVKSINKLPFHTPWRVILINKDAAGILSNRIILNLNEPCKIEGDLSWIKPQKFIGIWWEMHAGLGTWDYAAGQDMSSATGKNPHGKHSANTTNTKKYIDFASKYGFSGVLVEGWNVGWEDWFNKMKPEVFDFTKPYPDYDIDELTRYAKEKGVKIIMHHETSGAVPSYERQMNDAYAYMKKYNMDAVKTGYVGHLLPVGEWHDGQRMVNHYAEVARRTAQNKIMLDAHEPVRPSGLQRTWPNWLASEAGRGGEYNAWSKGNAPSHVLTLPFTRCLGGPMDYTPGIFETRMNTYDPKKKEIVQSTVANQLALFVTLYSPLQMAADLPENYEKRLDVFQFIRDVPVDWSETKIISAVIGDQLTIARRAKGTSNWYIGSITDETPRSFKIKLDFLEAGKLYEATIYADGDGANYITNPYPVKITKRNYRKGETITMALAAGGGCAVELKMK